MASSFVDVDYDFHWNSIAKAFSFAIKYCSAINHFDRDDTQLPLQCWK